MARCMDRRANSWMDELHKIDTETEKERQRQRQTETETETEKD